jgi:hypothetical protein
MPNRLHLETSPYLRQHADNPVDWYPWGDEAFAAAHRREVPVFLSIGYSACHWCHVMAHESFEDSDTATLMNTHFVCVKVDREERPDVDAIYMDAVHAMTGHGGWPMSVFLTPEAEPFYGGTYFPTDARHGLPAFADVLRGVADLWERDRSRLQAAAGELTAILGRQAAEEAGAPLGRLENETLETATRGLFSSFDGTNGGWGGAPKFPQPAVVEFALRRHLATGDEGLLRMVTRTLDAMTAGGIHDQLGGGFHRYATDERWLVPHFEKMLYDNAQLATLYLHAWQVTGSDRYRDVVTSTLDYVAREMLHPDGGFFSAQDADSEGEEGRFFVWTPHEVRAAVARSSPDPDGDAAAFEAAYGVTPGGNFEGTTILHVALEPAEVADTLGTGVAEVEASLRRARAALLSAREERIRPGLDDKVLAGWNGLMLAAFAETARVLDRDDYRAVAVRGATFLLERMRTADGRMLRSWKDGQAKLNGYLEDYAAVAEGLVELYQTTFDVRWLDAAQELGGTIVERFADEAGGFFDTSQDHEVLVVRPKSTQDGAIPSGGALATGVLVRLAEYTGDPMWAEYADAALARMQALMAQAPLGFARWLSALDLLLAPPAGLAVVGPSPEAMLTVARSRFRPNLLVAAAPAADARVALLADRDAIGGQTTAYLCRQFACERPVTDAGELALLLDGGDVPIAP